MAPQFNAIDRKAGCLPIEAYGVLGDGRTIALSGADGSLDWWCVPNMDSPPLFDRMLDPVDGGYFALAPRDLVRVERQYRPHSNVLETMVHTVAGVARITESLNSGTAGRLPWEELARRIEGISGTVHFDVHLRFGRRADRANPYVARQGGQCVFHVGRVLGVVLATSALDLSSLSDEGMETAFHVVAGQRELFAIIAGQDEPLIVPTLAAIDARIDASDDEWRRWTEQLQVGDSYKEQLIRHALSLKLLLYSPTGAIAAAGTTSLPEAIGGERNYDYRYAWVRDAGYTIKAFSRLGAHAEAKAAFTWLIKRLRDSDGALFYKLDGGAPPDVREIEVPGYRDSTPVVIGNQVVNQHQHGVYGDILETAARFVKHGNVLDDETIEVLCRLTDQCADHWRQKDSGIWELVEPQHYTMSKISAWQALARAVELADGGYLPTTCRDRWARERDRVAAWIEEHCWSASMGAFEMWPGSGQLDAAMALAVRFRFDGRDKLKKTLEAIDRTLGDGVFHYRYSDARGKEGCFLACTFWMAEGWQLLGEHDKAKRTLDNALTSLEGGSGTLAEMIDPASRAWLGNVPQGLSHLAAVHGILTVMGVDL